MRALLTEKRTILSHNNSSRIGTDFDCYGSSFHSGYLIWSISDGQKLVCSFPMLGMGATNEYKEHILDLVSGKPYLFVEHALVIFPLPEQVIACVVYQVTIPQC